VVPGSNHRTESRKTEILRGDPQYSSGPGHELDDRSSIPTGQDYVFATTSRSILGPTQPPIEWVPGSFFGDKATGA
jgi:hypothetical protein